MPGLYVCDQCGVKAWNRTPSSAGGMLTQNVLRKGTYCPSCGHDLKTGAIGDEDEPTTTPTSGTKVERATSDENEGESVTSPSRKRIACDIELDSEPMEFLKRHALVHVGVDWEMLSRQRRFSSHYLMAFSALRHFALGGTASIFNGAIGLIALLSSKTSNESLNYLCDLVAKETHTPLLPADSFRVNGFEIQDGSCVVVTLPEPAEFPEAHMIGIVTDATLDAPATGANKRRWTRLVGLFTGAQTPARTVKLRGEKASVMYFSMERLNSRLKASEELSTRLARWDRMQRHDLGPGPIPTLERFVDVLERQWMADR